MNFYPAEYGKNDGFPSSRQFFLGFVGPGVGLGIRSLLPFVSGSRVAVLCGERVSKIALHTLQVAEHQHLYDPYFAGYLLHSCDPNLLLNTKTLEVKAVRDIAAGDLLTLDYEHTEDTLYRSFRCECGAPACRGLIAGRLSRRIPLPPETGVVARSGVPVLESELAYRDGGLHLSNVPLREFVSPERTPTFVYSLSAVTANLRRMERALRDGGFAGRFRIYFALKANRHVGLVQEMARLTADSKPLGIDACTVPEIRQALANGCAPRDLSFTGCGLARRDVQVLLSIDGLALNCDSLTMLEWVGESSPGREVGLRINPEVGLGGNARLDYAGIPYSKFGIYPGELSRARAIARQYGLTISRLHCHAGCGILDGQLDAYREVLRRLARIATEFPDLRAVNVGGGLGVPLAAGDPALGLAAWVETLRESFGGSALEVHFEPGNYLVKNAGVLLLTVAYEEVKNGQRFVFLNGGFNLAPEPAFYQLPYLVMPLDDRRDEQQSRCTVAGNINEALDIWLADATLPAMPADSVAVVVNSGAYAASMASNHCMSGEFLEHLVAR